MRSCLKGLDTLKATLVTASDELRAELEPLTDFRLIQACLALDGSGDIADPAVAMRHVLASLARRWLELHEEIKVHSRHLKKLTKAAAPDLVAAFGIGPDIAAEMLVTAGDNTDRIPSDAALAKLCGACPIPASSGKTNGRHRLNRGGNRQANAALYRAIVVRMLAPANHRLRETAHLRGPLEERDHPLPQALPRPRDLQPPSAAEHDKGPRVGRVGDLTSIGASTPWPNRSSACTSPSSSLPEDRGRPFTTSSWPPWTGWTGGTTPDCCGPSAVSPRRSSRPNG